MAEHTEAHHHAPEHMEHVISVLVVKKEVEMFRRSFDEHTEHDHARFAEVREDMKDQRLKTDELSKGLSDLRGRIMLLGTAAIVLIPALTTLASVWIGSHGSAPPKP